MGILSDYKNICVVQRDDNGCIPTAIEWMLRYKGVSKIDFSVFQERFNLQRHGGSNDFNSVPNAIMKVYPNLRFEHKTFQIDQGKEKLNYIESSILNQNPCLLSITLTPRGAWHIVPVVEIDDRMAKVLWLDDLNIENQIVSFFRCHLEFIHNNWLGGQDILVLL